jgi:uncharacterized membrane protein
VDIIARPPLPAEDTPAESWIHPRQEGGTAAGAAFIRGSSPYPPLKTPPLFPAPGLRLAGQAAGTGAAREQAEEGPLPVLQDARTYQERFRQALRKLALPKLDAEELAARIDRRLILSETQLVGGAARSEKMEARNLDYAGKNLVAKQAIALKCPVEVLWVTPEGESSRLMGVPGALEKRGGETILALKTLPGGNEIRLPLGKISLLRRIKQSIFGE